MSRVEELEKQIKELDERKVALQHELELEKQKIEFEYPLKTNENYWFLNQVGNVFPSWWSEDDFDTCRYKIGNVFLTEDEAIKERDRRILLTRFRHFRDKCNGDWKPESDEVKYYIFLECINFKFDVSYHTICNTFNLFGYFKNKEDCKRAIELFGDEIKRLWVEE